MISKLSLFWATSVIGIVALQATSVRAQEAPRADEATGTSNQEIVVTATGRSARTFDVPLAVSVTSGEDLTRVGLTDIANISVVDPAVTVRQYGGGINSFIIRGIVSQGQPTTGIYYGESPLLGGRQTEGVGDSTPTLRLIDLDRIEVLKGPQGTLFGAGSMSGTIRAIPASPKLGKFEGEVSVQAGDIKGGDALFKGHAVLNVPLGSTLAIRAVGWAEEGGGFIDHQPLFGSAVLKNSNDTRMRGGRISVRWEPSPDFDLDLRYTHQSLDVDNGQLQGFGGSEYFNTLPTVEPFYDDLDMFSATATIRALGGDFTGNISKIDYSRRRRSDSTDSGIAFIGVPAALGFAQNVGYGALTGEVRYSSAWEGPFQLVAGAYFQGDGTQIDGSAVFADPDSGEMPCTSYLDCQAGGFITGNPADASIGEVVYNTYRDHHTRQQAYYAQGELKLTHTLTATAGIRYFRAKLYDDVTQTRTIFEWFAGTGETTPSYRLPPTTQEKVTYNFSLGWEVAPNLNTYARVASGFRIGGINDSEDAFNNFGVVIPGNYSPDSLWNYELGAKASLFDRRLLIDASVFYIDWTNQQLLARDPTGAVVYTINAAQTHIKGAELSLRSQPVEGLSLDAAVTYVSSKLAKDLPLEVVAAGSPGVKGDIIPYTPKWSAAIQAEYAAPVAMQWEAFVGGSLSYNDKAYDAFRSDPDRVLIPSSTNVDLRLGIRSDRYTIQLIAENVFDANHKIGVRTSIPGVGVNDRYYVGRPRVLSLGLSAKF